MYNVMTENQIPRLYDKLTALTPISFHILIYIYIYIYIYIHTIKGEGDTALEAEAQLYT